MNILCGIIGYNGYRQASPLILDALRRLEYRGYDSVGVAVTQPDHIEIRKDVGRVDEANKKHNFKEIKGTMGIGHTRWATHGGVTQENAHPHTSNNGKIAVIHNGIVENYQQLQEKLIQEGYRFYTETDTETIPNLIQYEMSQGKSFTEATVETVRQLEGYYAILAIHQDEDKIIGTRNGSPLVVGLGDGENYLASDIPAFLEFTKQVQYIHDHDLVILEDDKVEFRSTQTGDPINRPTYSVDWDLEQAQKGDFDHFMMKEITEQVETVKAAINQDKETLFHVADHIRDAKGVFLVACGSSYHACLTASYLFSKIAGMHVNVVLGSEFSNYEHFLTEDTLVIFVSQSGETIDVLDALKTAQRKNTHTVSIVNVVGSSLYRDSDHQLLLNAGPEICVLSTKTYTAQLTVLSLLIYTVANRYQEGKQELEKLWNQIYNLTSANTRNYIKTLANWLQHHEHIFLIGRGLQYPTAMEAALKIKEVSYIHAEGFSGGELKHGTIALIEQDTPCITFSSSDTEQEIISNAMEIKARGGYIIGVNHTNNPVFDFYIKVPDAGDLNPVTQIIPIQILSYQLAVLRGADPDKPRNLAKSVTVK